DGIEVGPEVGGDGVVGHVGDHAGDAAVLDLPEDVATELAVVALLVDRVAAAAVDHDAVTDVGDHVVAGRRSGGSGADVDVGHAEERVVAPGPAVGAAAAEVLAEEVV